MESTGDRRPRRSCGRHSLLIAAALVGGSQLVSYLVFMGSVALSGDEIVYVSNAHAIAAALRGLCRLDTAAVQALPAQLVNLGWFMPGMSFLLAPVVLLTDSIPVLRLYVGLLNLFVTLAILRRLARRSAAAPLVFTGGVLIVPYYGIYAFTAWGDLLAAHLLLLLFLVVLDRVDGREPGVVSWRAAAGIGFALGLITYVRGFQWFFVPIFAVLIVLGTDGGPPLRTRVVRAGGRVAVCAVALFATILPWTLAVSARHGFHLTTTSTTLSRICLLGSASYFEGGPRRGDAAAWQRLITARAAANGRSFATQAAIERSRALAGTSLSDAGRRLHANVHRFFFDSEAFLERFRRLAVSQAPPPSQPALDRAYTRLQAVNHVGWRVLLGLGLVIFFMPISLSRRFVSLSVVYKCVLVIFTMHPLTVLAHGRYYVEYVPFIAAALAGLASTSRLPILAAWPRFDADEWLIGAVQATAMCVGGALCVGFILLG